jgi:DNA replication and repair protein RecF
LTAGQQAFQQPAQAFEPESSSTGASESFNAVSVQRLTLADFRNYDALRLPLAPQTVVLTGPNGAGKTNLLEALSFLSPGRGLRRARLRDVTRNGAAGQWSVAARIAGPRGIMDVGSGLAAPAADTADKRIARVDGETVSPASLATVLGVQWLTPQMDRLFLEGAGDRRRFLDRLVFGFDREHSRRVAHYERAMRERARLLKQGRGDATWFDVLEARMAADGVAIAAARQDAVARLSTAMAASTGAFPVADMQVAGYLEDLLDTVPAVEAEARFQQLLCDSRRRDAEYGGAVEGPHRSDLAVRHVAKDAAAAQCSTGEQKALLIAIQLANARLEAARRGVGPILLLDEVAAHLDEERRAALFEEIEELRSQVWLTGTDRALFEALYGRAQFFRVESAHVMQEDA